MTIIILSCILLTLLLNSIVFFVFKFFLKKKENKIVEPTKLVSSPININLSSVENLIKDLPSKVLQSITNSSNTHKGALGELIGYIQLRSNYDRIIPLGNIVDFIGIKFAYSDKEGKEHLGYIDFIDVKTGESARLSKDQRELQKLVKARQVNFIKLKIDTVNVNTFE